jgi:hypothetical protein
MYDAAVATPISLEQQMILPKGRTLRKERRRTTAKSSEVELIRVIGCNRN